MKKILTFLIFIGMLGLALNTALGAGTFAFMTKIDIGNGLYSYKVDYFNYILNIRDSFSDLTRLELNMIPISWDTSGDIAAVSNNLMYIADIFIFALNLLIYPFRIGGYMVINICAFLGIKTQGTLHGAGGLNWLVALGRVLTNLQIPFLQ